MSNDLDQLPVKELHDVDWDHVTEQQAAVFGLSLALFNDACEAHSQALAVLFSRASSAVVASLVGIILLSWSNPVTAVVGMISSLALHVGISWWQTRRTRKVVDAATESLKADVGQLPQG